MFRSLLIASAVVFPFSAFGAPGHVTQPVSPSEEVLIRVHEESGAVEILDDIKPLEPTWVAAETLGEDHPDLAEAVDYESDEPGGGLVHRAYGFSYHGEGFHPCIPVSDERVGCGPSPYYHVPAVRPFFVRPRIYMGPPTVVIPPPAYYRRYYARPVPRYYGRPVPRYYERPARRVIVRPQGTYRAAPYRVYRYPRVIRW